MVASLNRPGGNLTGVALLAFPLGPKRLEVLREALPGAKVIAVLANPTMAEALPYTKDVAAVARTLGQQIQILNASNDQELESRLCRDETTRGRRGAGHGRPIFQCST